MAMPKLATLTSACLASTICVKIVALTVTRDPLLPIAGNGDLAHVDALQTVDERSDDHQTGLVRLAVLAQALDDTDLTLLHDVDHVLQHHQQDAERQNGDDETTDGE